MSLLTAAKDWARRIKRDVVAVYFAARDARTPWPARCLAVAVAAYALSPIDLIPDFIPVLGYLDDLLIVPLGLLLVIRMLPPAVLQDARDKAASVLPVADVTLHLHTLDDSRREVRLTAGTPAGLLLIQVAQGARA